MEKQIKNRFEKVEKRIEHIEKTLFSEGLSKKGNLVKCSCGYSWITHSKALLISCPRCGNKVRIKKVEKKKKDLYVKGKDWVKVAKKTGII